MYFEVFIPTSMFLTFKLQEHFLENTTFKNCFVSSE